MQDWSYQGKYLTEVPEGAVGFVYMIINNVTQKKYVGRKYFYSTVKKPPLKGKKRKRVVTTESKWKSYFGSSEYLKEDIKELGKENFHREILSIHTGKGLTNYAETSALFRLDVLNSLNEDGEREYYNSSISGKYFPMQQLIITEEQHAERKLLNELSYYSNLSPREKQEQELL